MVIGAYFKRRYQILWTVYRKERGDSIYQLHIIVNSVSFVDGKLYNSSTEELSRLCAHIQRFTAPLAFTGLLEYFLQMMRENCERLCLPCGRLRCIYVKVLKAFVIEYLEAGLLSLIQ